MDGDEFEDKEEEADEGSNEDSSGLEEEPLSSETSTLTAASTALLAAAPAAKKGKKFAANAIPAALVEEAANESIAAVADGSAPNISLQKKKKDFSSSYADVKEKELLRQGAQVRMGE